MITIGRCSFPESSQEAASWEEISITRALHRQVLCFAHTRVEGAWCAYCFPVPGRFHEQESFLWETEGDKMPEAVALAMFPEFEGIPYAH